MTLKRHRVIAAFASPKEDTPYHPEGKPVQRLLIAQDILLPATYIVREYDTEVYVTTHIQTPGMRHSNETIVMRGEWDDASLDIFVHMIYGGARDMEQYLLAMDNGVEAPA